LIREIAGWAPDALLVFSWSYRSNLAVLRHFKGKIPIFFRGDSHLLDEQPGLKTGLRRTLLRWVYRHVDYAFYVGENNRQYFRKHGLKAEQLLFAPHAVDNRRFQENASAKTAEALAWRRQLGIPQDAIVFLFAAKLESKKDPELLLNAFARMDHPKAYLVMVGNGPLEAALKAQYPNHPRILFLPFQNQSQMPLVYRLGQVFVLPSRGPAETWGLAINEAMACGLAVVASTKVGCATDLVRPGQNGYVFEAGQPESLHSALGQLLQEPARIAEMGQASLQRITDWSIGKAVDGIEQGVLGREAARRPSVFSAAARQAGNHQS
jgi:glycosyltransferase involved in cell wall biosynthesis